MKRCKNATAYKALKYPTCNKGLGCDTCNSKYRKALEEQKKALTKKLELISEKLDRFKKTTSGINCPHCKAKILFAKYDCYADGDFDNCPYTPSWDWDPTGYVQCPKCEELVKVSTEHPWRTIDHPRDCPDSALSKKLMQFVGRNKYFTI